MSQPLLAVLEFWQPRGNLLKTRRRQSYTCLFLRGVVGAYTHLLGVTLEPSTALSQERKYGSFLRSNGPSIFKCSTRLGIGGDEGLWLLSGPGTCTDLNIFFKHEDPACPPPKHTGLRCPESNGPAVRGVESQETP